MADFRSLLELIWRQTAPPYPSLYYAVLVPWIEANQEHVAWLAAFARRTGSPIPPADVDDLWDLYSISRVNEFLLLCFQPGELPYPERRANYWKISLEEYTSFMLALGFTIRPEAQFTPALHEIVDVTPSENADEPITLIGECWPALMLGDMVFSRAGAFVGGGSNNIRKDVAEQSTMFWAWRRRNRPALDLSAGWGSNSQWRTDFRRDYIIGDRVFLNVDGEGKTMPGHDQDELSAEEQQELLMHRCFVKSEPATVAADLWPYYLNDEIPLVMDHPLVSRE